MITGIGSVSTSRAVDLQSSSIARSAEPTPSVPPSATTEADKTDAPSSPISELAAQGAPVDTDKVSAIRAGIANGTYKVDARAIANSMIASDLQVRV